MKSVPGTQKVYYKKVWDVSGVKKKIILKKDKLLLTKNYSIDFIYIRYYVQNL